MRIIQTRYSPAGGWQCLRDDRPETVQLVIAFGSFGIMQDPSLYAQLRDRYNGAAILMNSCETVIAGTGLNHESVSVTAISFDATTIRTAVTHSSVAKNSHHAGYMLARALDTDGLKNVLVITGGTGVYGGELADSLSAHLPQGVIITGGMAGHRGLDGDAIVGLNNIPDEGSMVAIGFYGTGLRVQAACMSGWQCFGPERIITRARENELYELNDQKAMDLYRMYLGSDMDKLPHAGLLYPVSINMPGSEDWILRTVMGFNETDGSVVFAGNMPEGARCKFMKTTTDALIQAASDAARHTVRNIMQKPELALLISCVGRELVLESRTEEEVEVIRSIYGTETALAGFYARGEISPVNGNPGSRLHNQTITITTFSERAEGTDGNNSQTTTRIR